MLEPVKTRISNLVILLQDTQKYMDIFATLQNVLGQGGGHMDVYYTTLLPNSTFGENLEIKLQGYSFCCAGSSLWCTGFSLQSLLLQQSSGSTAHFSSCSLQALLPHSTWTPPRAVTEPESSAQTGRFFTGLRWGPWKSCRVTF